MNVTKKPSVADECAWSYEPEVKTPKWCYQGSPRPQKCWQEQDQTTVTLKSALIWDITKRVMVITDVPGQPLGPTLKDTSVRNYHYTLRNISEEDTSHRT